ncbi:AraC family transcriptional regulator [Methylorubrum rhodinum]|uniref:AraC family transcriptional regulator n=1 Tax=Methylorubrum rhodinum TaxID=29428 RepID=A0A840ZU07_9HYPH|nr:AraC family transcriptional regulator [Methylorubrum rhodinum]MBB5760331.1 AraC family transcriptional regulator [Methylorubrum rhodinum]
MAPEPGTPGAVPASTTFPWYAEASTRCAGAKPNALLRSSRGAGWSALLLDHHEGRGHSEVFETHPTPDLTLVVATRGEHRIAVAKRGLWRTAVYQPGAMGLTPPYETTRMRWSTAGERAPFRSIHLYLPHDLITDVAQEYRRLGAPSATPPLSSLVFRDPVVAACAVSLLRALETGSVDLYAEQTGQWLAAHLLSRHAGWWSGDEGREPGLITDRRLARVLDFMTAHLGEPLTLGRLAREAGISVHHFGRRFRERMGATPHAYLTAVRMDAARRLLRTSDLPVSEVALTCGYTRPAAFAAAFQRHVGVAPSTYRGTRHHRENALEDRGAAQVRRSP